MTDTTGQIIMHSTDSGTRMVIAEDMGAYPGTTPEHNVRKLRTVETIELTITHSAVRAVTDRHGAYGCGWGDTGLLHPITATDIDTLHAAVAAEKAARPSPSPAAPEWRSPRGKTLTEEMDDPNSIY